MSSVRFRLRSGALLGASLLLVSSFTPLAAGASSASSQLAYSTFIGGSATDFGWDVGFDSLAFDTRGNSYIVGLTNSPDFPTTPGSYDTTPNGAFDVFVSKFSPTGNLVYSTVIGGPGNDEVGDIEVDTAGNAYVVGTTSSSGFPTTPHAYDRSFAGASDVFVLKLDPAGSSLAYSTFIGGTGVFDVGLGISIDGHGNAYVTGRTESSDFPTTPAAYDTTFAGEADVFVSKLSPDGSRLIYSSLLGGPRFEESSEVAVDARGAAHVVGRTFSPSFPTTVGAYDESFNGDEDIFVARLAPTGVALEFSTFIGGASFDFGNDLVIDALGNASIVGETFGDYPTTAQATDRAFSGPSEAIVTKLNSRGSALVYSTYLGGASADRAASVALDSSGNAFVTGDAGSADFPVTPHSAYDATNNGGEDVFVTELDGVGRIAYSTFIGGISIDNGRGIRVDASGNPVVTGFTGSADFPTTHGAYDTTWNGELDAFLLRLALPN